MEATAETAAPPKLKISCCNCGTSLEVKPTSKGKARTPKGWKTIDGNSTCQRCWGLTYHVGAITIAVASAAWDEFLPALKQAQTVVMTLSNWAIRRLLANDIVRSPDDTKLKPMPEINLYQLAPECGVWDQTSKGTAAAVLRTTEAAWRKARFGVIWQGNAAPPSFRFPQPVPLRPDGFDLRVKDEQRLVCNVLLNGQRFDLLLAGGGEWRRQTQILKWFIEHPDLLCESAIITQDVNPGDHRAADDSRASGASPRKMKRTMVKIVGWLPIKSDVIPGNTVNVRTAKDALLVCVDQDDKRVWIYNADHAKRVADRHAAHLSQLSRLSDDHKAELRRPRREGRSYRYHLANKVKKDKNRLQNLCHTISASVIEYAKRRKAADLVYDESDKSFAPSFPWYKLSTMIEQKARAAGIIVKCPCHGIPIADCRKRKGKSDAAETPATSETEQGL